VEKFHDYIVRSLVNGSSAVLSVAATAAATEKARRLHGTSPIATAALGRVLTLAGIMGVGMKEGQEVTIQVRCTGPLGGVLAQGNWKGEVRGYVSQPLVVLPSRQGGKLNVEDAVGKGSELSVIRDLGMKEPYVGTVAVHHGGIACDLASYFLQSEQLPTACGAGVLVGTEGTVLASGGFIVHTPSGVEKDTVEHIERNLGELGSLSELLKAGDTPEILTTRILAGVSHKVVEKRELVYHCRCSRFRAERALVLLGKEALERIIHDEGKGEVTCPFCSRTYHFDSTKMLELSLKAKSSGGDSR